MGLLKHSLPAPLANGAPMRAAREVHVSEFHSQDQDETRAYIAPNYGVHTRVIHGRGPFSYSQSIIATGRVTAGRVVRRLRQTLRAEVQQPTLFLSPLPGETVQFGRRTHVLDDALAVICTPDQQYTLRGSSKGAQVLRVNGGLLEHEVDTRLRGRSRRWVLGSTPVRMTADRRADLDAYFAQLRNVAHGDGSWGSYASAEYFERAVAGWMAELLLESGGVTPIAELSLNRLARLERWIDEHLGEDLTLDRLCGVAGVSSRPVQRAFLSVRGQTPLEYVHARRLAAVRRQLESAPSNASISSIALDYGFRHLGRFAAEYRTAYGESPSETLRSKR